MMLNKEKNFISAVVYIRDDYGHIESFLSTLMQIFNDNFEHSEIICVNDYSSDNSVREVLDMKSKMTGTTELTLLNLSYFHGLEVAMNAGTELAIGDFIFEFDSVYIDYDTAEVMNVYRKSLEGFDIVSAVPNKKQKRTSSLFYRVYKKYSKNSVEMHSESFSILSRRAINRITSLTKRVLYRKALYANCGLKMTDLVYEPAKDCISKPFDGKQKKYRRELAMDSLLLFTDVGYSICKTLTYLMSVFLIACVVYALVVRAQGLPVAGWTSTILFLSVAFLGLFIILTIVTKYLQLVISITFNRKQYSYESVEKIKNIKE